MFEHSLVIDHFHQHCIRQMMIFVAFVVIPSEYIKLCTSCSWCVIYWFFVGYGNVVFIHGVLNTIIINLTYECIMYSCILYLMYSVSCILYLTWDTCILYNICSFHFQTSYHTKPPTSVQWQPFPTNPWMIACWYEDEPIDIGAYMDTMDMQLINNTG